MTFNEIMKKDLFKNVRPRKENKGSDKTSACKDLILFNPLHLTIHQ